MKKSKTPYVHSAIIHNKNAARVILPKVFDIVKPHSVLDVGCGLGTWLSVCDELGVKDLLGLDGDFIDREKLVIPTSNFKNLDLRKHFSLNREFSLVICLEVAEHLPESSADLFVENLTTHSNTILFSAAVPGQGGQNHINEQWPAYWQKKFEIHGYHFHDLIRPLIWNNEKVEWWYKQNIYLLTKEASNEVILNYYHPECFKEHVDRLMKINEDTRSGRLGVRESFKILTRSIRQLF